MKIVTINRFHPKELHEWSWTVGRKSKYKQIKNIKHSCRAGKDIYTLPHQDSVLSEIFVRPHLDDKGYIIEGEYCVNLDGDLIVYSLTSILTGLNEFEQYNLNPER